ncbi:MAG TPA: hypothetical protein VFE38_10935 [Edaphobacter sp.]|nr:hypothetical protein [Edaphobacter sp.]
MTEEQKDATEQKSAVGQMLPGVAGICLFMLFLTMMNVFGALRNAFGSGITKYGVLSLCTLLVIGIFGLMRMRRWGWALVLAGCVLLFTGDFIFFEKMHAGFFLIRGMFSLIFFLYLVRDEVRSRLR